MSVVTVSAVFGARAFLKVIGALSRMRLGEMQIFDNAFLSITNSTAL
jgi:hypothetical protein